ncbi:dTDP-4-dehydrorhamnose reductase [Rheinheimera baltica]|uniref:dTDP-4-dehydrorhamnose reductase n=1 Tax=Rheinheimera baltica TaxID=67576 RepID=UPI00273F9780|nr:dTDP-4-dehydrorhamnose reductase [Rheinheimera baltica]MDP5143088.1 dTDP-4-dehydrorhamnose reductase [Rheinheimera baltica]
MRNIVLLAPNGQVGFELAHSLVGLGQLHCLSRADVDFSQIAQLIDKIEQYKPDIIVNAAAWTAVDKAETEPAAAYLLNATLPEALAELAQRLDAWLVHYSTDYVYSGSGDIPWQEQDTALPLSIYGQSKLAGDEAIQRYCEKYLIFRTSWVYAARGNNFMLTMLQLAQRLQSLQVVADQFGAPTSAALIAKSTVHALTKVLDTKQATAQRHALSGIYHLATQGTTSWFDFAQAIFALAQKHGLQLTLAPNAVTPIATAQYKTAAVRPQNSRLNLHKTEQVFGLTFPDWQSELERTYCHWDQTRKSR